MRFYVMYLGTLVPIVVYSDLAARSGWSLPAVAGAAAWALALHAAWVLVTWRFDEVKPLDLGLVVLWVIATVTTRVGPAAVADVFLRFSPALVFATLGTTALLPLVVGGTPFVDYYARRGSPAWQLALPASAAIVRLVTACWVAVFYAGAVLAAWRPADPVFNTLLPNLLVVLVGLPAGLWISRLYLRWFPPSLPDRIEPILLGMPFAFDPAAAGDARATFQFHVSGRDAGDWCVHVAGGQCASYVGTAAAPDLVLRTPDDVWLGIVRGELNAGEAIGRGLLVVQGDFALLPKLDAWFRR